MDIDNLLKKYGEVTWTTGFNGDFVAELSGAPLTDTGCVGAFCSNGKTMDIAIREIYHQLHDELWDMVDWLEEVKDEYGEW